MSDGWNFELDVYKTVRRYLRMKRFGLLPGACETYLHKRYFSSARAAEIETDISIELVLPGTSNPALIWVWECKDYTRPVSVDAVEEFHSKLQQIGSDNTKGTLVTRSSFQRSALQYAKHNGIGLARLLPHKRFEYYQGYSSPPEPPEDVIRQKLIAAALEAITEEEYSGPLGGLVLLDSQGHPLRYAGLDEYLRRELSLSGFHRLPLWRSDVNLEWWWERAHW